jgi:hypothetical protein
MEWWNQKGNVASGVDLSLLSLHMHGGNVGAMWPLSLAMHVASGLWGQSCNSCGVTARGVGTIKGRGRGQMPGTQLSH